MTCVVGYKDIKKGRVYIGADSLGSSTYTKTVRSDPKIFKYRDDIIIGFSASYRMGQLLMYSPDLIPTEDIMLGMEINHEYMVTKFIPRMITMLKENNYGMDDSDDGSFKIGKLLIAVKDHLWKIDSDCQVAESVNDYMAVGSGEEIALGALYALEKRRMSITDKITIALEGAEKFSTGVQRPFIIYHT